MGKRILLKAGSLLLILALCFSVIGCGDKKAKKYELAFKVVIEGYDNEIIMMPEDDELHITIPSDGEKHEIKLYYQKQEHPQHSNIWFEATIDSPIDTYLFLYENGKESSPTYQILEKSGTYLYIIDTLTTDSWDHTFRRLYIEFVEES